MKLPCLALVFSLCCFSFTPEKGFAESDFSEKYSYQEIRYARRIFSEMVKQINAKYGVNLTPREACALVREHIDEFHMPNSLKALVLELIDLMEKGVIDLPE